MRETYKEKLVSFILKRSLLVVIVMMILLALSVLGMMKMGREYSHRIWFKQGDVYLQEFDEFQAVYGNDENIVIAYKNQKGILDDQSLAKIKKIENILWETPNVVRVDSLMNNSIITGANDEVNISPFEEVAKQNVLISSRKKILSSHPELQNYLINKDYNTTLIYARFRPIEKAVIEYNKSLNHLHPKLKEIKLDSSEVIHVGGTVPLNISFSNTTNSDMRKVLPLVILSILVLIYFSFKSFYVLLLIMFEIGFTIIYSLGFAGWIGINFSMILSMVPCIIAAVALADSVHIFGSYKYNMVEGDYPKVALKKALKDNIRPTLLTTFSTAFGFIGLSASELKPIHDLGIVAGFGVIAAWFTSYFLVAPLLNLKAVELEKTKLFSFVVSMDWVKKNATSILTLAIFLLSFGGYFAFKNEVNSNIIKYFSKDSEIRMANEFLLKNIGGYSGVQIVLDSGSQDGIKDPIWIQNSAELIDKISKLPYVVKVSSIHTSLEKIHNVLGESGGNRFPKKREQIAQELLLFQLSQPVGKDIHYWLDRNYQTIRVDVLWNVDTSKKSVEAINELRALINSSQVKGKVTGKAALITGLDQYILTTFVKSIFISLIFVLIFMSFSFKSLKMGLLTLIPNICPPLIGLGFLTLLGGNIDVGVILIVSVCLGISVDDTIYFFSYLFKYKKRYPNLTIDEQLKKVLNHSSRSLTLTTFILAISFGLFIVADFTPNRNFGVVTSIVLLGAYFFDLFVIPAFLSKISHLGSK
ncbi:MAG: MMPL family transporter [Oligoflexia bacterium]|nr:MMPL family transporter [Oligoflexia bacterium]